MRISPAIRIAAAKDGNTVYALFQRWNGSGPGGRNVTGDIVVVKEDNAGASTLTFDALGMGTLVRNNIVLPL